MKVIQAILYLTAVIHLVHCCPIRSDLNDYTKVPNHSLNCSNDSVLKDISQFNNISVKLFNQDNDVKISDETVR